MKEKINPAIGWPTQGARVNRPTPERIIITWVRILDDKTEEWTTGEFLTEPIKIGRVLMNSQDMTYLTIQPPEGGRLEIDAI